ncbi:MAG: phosphatase PAP2 family protein [Thermoplasmata archaeon]
MNIVDIIVIIQLIVTFPIGIYVFGGKTKVTLSGFKDMCDYYRWHFFILIAMYLMKTFSFYLEGPMEKYATDYTQMIYGLEGNTIFWFQHYLQSFPMTLAMAAVYIGSFLFIMVFTFAFLSYLNMKKAASKVAMLYLVLFFLTLPFYLFMIVYVPSYPKMLYPGAESIITGMEPLMYNFGPNVHEFFVNYDSFNNCFPSMHIGYPAAILMSLHLNVKGYRIYKWFLFTLLVLIAVAIVYLGIHWFSDIVGGIFIALIGVIITEKYAHRFWRHIDRFDKLLRKRYKWWDAPFELIGK